MLKRNPAPFEQQRVSVPIEEQEQKCLSVCAIRYRECVKRVLLFPRLERQTQAANERRTRNIRRISEPRSEWLAQPVCRALWFFAFSPYGRRPMVHAMKERRRKTTKWIYDKSLKAKNCWTIQGRANPAPTALMTYSADSYYCFFFSLWEISLNSF